MVLYHRWKRNGRRQKRLDRQHKVEEDTDHPDYTKFAPLPEDALQPHPSSSQVPNSKEANLGHKLDDDKPARSSIILRPVPMLHPTATVLRSPHNGRSGVREPIPDLPGSSVSLAPFLSGDPMADIPLDQAQLSQHPRPNFMTRMK